MAQVKCTNCMEIFDEKELIYDGEWDTDFCPYCGECYCIEPLDMKSKLIVALYAKYSELLNNHIHDIKTYEIAFQETIEHITGGIWWEVTTCNIFMHLLEYKDPNKTITAIIENLKEEYKQ